MELDEGVGIAGGGTGAAEDVEHQRRTEQDLEEVLAPKVRGTLVLDELLQDEPLDFFVLCSSLASTLGPAGQVAYVAANAFQDAFASSRGSASGVPTVSINWDTWREVGMAVTASRKLTQPRAPSSEPSSVVRITDWSSESGFDSVTGTARESGASSLSRPHSAGLVKLQPTISSRPYSRRLSSALR